jgi:hypothetical protein
MIRLAIILSVLSISPAYSYIDPGSGSMLIQAIMAAGLGGLMFFKQIKLAILSFFVKKPSKNLENNAENSSENNI